METTGKKPSFHLSGADGVRALACLSVIFHHLTQRLAMQEQAAWVQEVQSFFLIGSSGVSVFFVLSGFLLSFPFWKQYLENGRFPGIKTYILRRAARIMPGFYVALLFSVLLGFLLHTSAPHFWIRLFAGLSFTAGFHYVTLFPSELNGPLWSISFEVFCYVLMPIMMLGLFRLSGMKRSFTKALLYWAVMAAIIFAANRLVHAFLTPDDVERGWEYGLIGGAKYWMPNYNPVGFFAHFCVGIIASGFAVKWGESEKAGTFKKKGGFDFISLASLIGAATLLWIVRHKPEFSFSLQNQPYYFPAYALLIGILLSAAPHSLWAGKLLDNRFFRYTAKVSFGLYIWHYLVITVISAYWVYDFQYMRLSQLSQWLLVSLSVLAISYVIATLSYYFIEKPVLDWAHDRSRTHRSGFRKAAGLPDQ